MPRGGARSGAGRKPDPSKKKKGAVVLDLDGKRRDIPEIPPALESVAGSGSVEESPAESSAPALDLLSPPDGLRADAGRVWIRYAPFAIQQGTLIASTVGGFKQLCKALALAETLLRSIHRKGAGTKDAESALRLYIRLDQRVDAMMGRFKLTAFGKPADPGFTAGAGAPRPKPPVNPWSRVATK